MNKNQTHLIMNRRNFLKLLGIGGLSVATAVFLDAYAPWLDYDGTEELRMKPFNSTAKSNEQKLELIRLATLAASGHNTQPWKFAIKEDNIRIYPDYNRRLPIVDPNHREMWISLGCALENLIVASNAVGYASEVIYPDAADHIDIRLTKDTPLIRPLYEFIPIRQNTRSEYDHQPVKTAHLEEMQSLPLEPGISLQFAVDSGEMERYLEYINQGNVRQYSDKAFVDELIRWIRFNKKEALKTRDGLFSRCSGSPEVPHLIGQWFVAGTKPQSQADADAKKFRSASGAVVIASVSDDKTHWVRAGQVYERMALKMTSLNIKSAFLNQPIEVPELRDQFQSAIGLGASLPQLLVRFGYAEALPYSLRRPIDQVLL